MSLQVVPGADASPVVVHVPHASRTLPADARDSILLDDADLERELDAMTDARTDVLAERAAAAVAAADPGRRPWRFVTRLSRLVVDPERFCDDAREEMTEVGMGVVYTRTSDLRRLRHDDPERDAAYVARWFHPYAEALADLVDERLAATGSCLLLDLHSYPREALAYERHAGDRRPEVCLGTDRTHTPDRLVAAARTAFAPLGAVVLDEPFAGTYVPLRHLGREPRVRSIMVELRRDTYAGAPEGPDRVVAALARLLAAGHHLGR